MTSQRQYTCEPCPSCPTGELLLITGRTQAFFGNVLALLDLKQCNHCGFWQEISPP